MEPQEDDVVVLTPKGLKLGRLGKYFLYQYLLGTEFDDIKKTLLEAGWSEDYLIDPPAMANLGLQGIEHDGRPQDKPARVKAWIADYEKEFAGALVPKP